MTINIAIADCNEIYLDRVDLAQKQFADMDIADEYDLDKPRLLKHPNIYKILLKNIPRLKLLKDIIETKENNEIKDNLTTKLKNKNIQIYEVINLKNQSRKAFFIKENLSENNYYSMIFYVNLSCDPFKNKIRQKTKKKIVNDKKIQNNK